MRRGGAPGACARHLAGTGPALGLVLCLAMFLAHVTPTLARAQKRRSIRQQPIPVTVSFDRTEPGAPVPRDFLGLSFEVASLPQIASYAEGGDFIEFLHSLGIGVLRFGGVTADTVTAWSDAATPRPAWASGVVEPPDLRRLGSLAAASGWRILLTIGLAHYDPETAAREAAAAKAALGPWLEAIELGNEPNAYASHELRPEPWTFLQYDEEIGAYRSAIEASAPGIPLAGPDVSGSSAFESWGLGEVIDQSPALLTGHHYPLGCNQVPAPTIPLLLSPEVRWREDASLERYVSLSEASDIPFRLDESNSVSCGGVAGISNTFASALWAVGYLTQAMSAGVAGINLQGNPANCQGYTPLCAPTPEDLASGALVAQPEWYALLLAKALIGDRPLHTRTSSPERPNVEVRALAGTRGKLHFVVVDDDPPGSRSISLRLQVGSGLGDASILSLTAPSPAALSGVRLGGVAVAPDGSWREPPTLPRAADVSGLITVTVRPSSAALLTVPAARG